MSLDDGSTELLDTQRLQKLLDELVQRLLHRGVETRVYLLGGAALALAYYNEGERRLTNDIDAVFYPADVVADEAEALALRHGLRSTWLNSKVGQFLPAHGVPEGAVLIRRGNVEVLVGPPRLILAMKLRAGRLGRDNDDIAVLLRRCDIRSVDEAVQVLDEAYDGEESLKPMARAMVEAALLEYAVQTARPPFTLPPMPSRS